MCFPPVPAQRQSSFRDFPHRSGRAWRLMGLLVIAVVVPASGADAAGPRVLPLDKLPADTRLGPLRGEQGDFSFVPAKSPEEWKQRSEQVRRILRVTLGLWPMPTPTPLCPILHGKIDGGDYTVEKVYFESLPGF